MLYTLVVYFILPITLILYLLRLWNAPDPPSDWRRVLLVTAHPDDECMFFGPTLVRLLGHEIASTGKIGERTVKLLCLSTGNGDGLGRIRSKELYASCRRLGIPDRDVEVLDEPNLQDGMNVIWEPRRIADLVGERVEKHEIDTVITFDDYGVSGHPNHRACHGGIRLLASSKSFNATRKVYVLESIGLWRKYLAFVEAAIGLVGIGKERRISFVSAPFRAQAAMTKHASQLVWFRYFYIILSSYMYANTLKTIE